MLKIGSNTRLKKFPYWLRQSVRFNEGIGETNRILSSLQLNTVCKSARCPNVYDCFSKKRCTFLILGEFCTRDCRFCSVKKNANLGLPDEKELFNIKDAVKELGLENVIITSVTRDDLLDGGASHFADCIEILRGEAKIEVLVPDFCGNEGAIAKVVSAKPGIFAHNIETVPRLYSKVRPQADYNRSIAKELDEGISTKSGLMVGLGETRNEIYSVMKDLRDAGCDIITIGQYLKPDASCLDVEEFLHPAEFDKFSTWAEELGFKDFSCSPFARSSYL